MSQGKSISPDDACPCGNGAYARCCGPFHEGDAVPATAEQLMRSRYSAYALGRHDYVLDTWHASTRPAAIEPDDAVRLLGLEVREHVATADTAEVEFVATCSSRSRRRSTYLTGSASRC